MSLVSPNRIAGTPRPNKKVKDRLPSFQQLQQTKHKSSAATDKTVVPHPIISPTSTAESTEDDGDMISTTPIVSLARLRQHQHHQRRGSDSLSQWDNGDDDAPNDTSSAGNFYGNAYKSLITPSSQQIGGLAAMKELDIALNTVASSSSEANYSVGEETAVTGNMSAFSSPNYTPFLTNSSGTRRVTPRNTPKSNLSSCQEEEEETPEPSTTSRRLFMCGAVDVTNEIKGSFQDVNDTVRQIFTTVRRFGPDEKDAVKDTLKDAQSFVKQKVLAGILSKNRCGGGGAAAAARSPDDDDDDEKEHSDLRDNNSSKRRDHRDETARGRKVTSSILHDVRRRRGSWEEEKAKNVDDFGQESKEVVYENHISGMERSELERLKVFEC